MALRFYIEDNLPCKREVEYVLRKWSVNTGQPIGFHSIKDDCIVITKQGNNGALTVDDNWKVEQLSKVHLGRDGFIPDSMGQPDYLLTAFYLINSLQEYPEAGADLDELGRFKFANSHQNTNGTITTNLVQNCFDRLSDQLKVKRPRNKTRFFLTHDIDLVHGAILEDGFNVLKKGRVDQFLALLFNVAVGRPDWLNMDKIMKIESMYDCKSVFYWIVNKGVLNKRERNADYSFASSRIQEQVRAVASAGFENGIHKSISPESFKTEFEKYGSVPFANRYHYLKFSLPQAYHDIEDSGLKLDASLGFAEHFGFRNNYGLPFNPYNFKEGRAFSFIEVPLHVMDRTFFQYQKLPTKDAEQRVLNFFENNKENCVFSILWHNNFFTNYKFKGYLDLYKKILAYVKDNGHNTISQKEIFEQYSIVR